MTAFSKGDEVTWNWGEGTAGGTVQEVHTKPVTKTLKGSEVTRNGSKDCPAYTIRQDDGDTVLKLHSELEDAS